MPASSDYTAALSVCDVSQTAAAAARLAGALQPGDVVYLIGPLGAGKTTFARAVIAALSGGPVEVVSPTYTLVQTYETPRGAVWHGDLYRIEAPQEIEQLGLEDAFAEAMCLIEWPDRLGPYAPARRVEIEIVPLDAESRRLTLTQVGQDEERLHVW